MNKREIEPISTPFTTDLLDDNMWHLLMEVANIKHHSLAALNLVPLETIDLSYR